MIELTFQVAYPFLQKIENIGAEGLFEVQNIQYSDMILGTILFPETEKQHIKTLLSDLTSGSIKFLSEVSKNT